MLIPKNVCVCIWNTAQNVSFLWSLAKQSCLCFQWINPRYWSGSLMSTDEGSSAKWIIVDWSPQGLAAPVPAVYSSWVIATAPATRGTRTGEQRSTDPCLERWSETHPESFWHTPMKTNTGAVLFLPKDITWSVCFSTAIVSYFCFKESWTNINFLSDRSPGEKQKTALLWHPGHFLVSPADVFGQLSEKQHCCWPFLLSELQGITVREQTGCTWASGGFKDSRLVALSVPCCLLGCPRNPTWLCQFMPILLPYPSAFFLFSKCHEPASCLWLLTRRLCFLLLHVFVFFDGAFTL